MKIILKIHDNIKVVDSSLKDQEMMVVRFSKSVQKKDRQNKTKEKKREKQQQQKLKIKRRANKQTNKEKEQIVKSITSLAKKRLEMVLLFQGKNSLL